MNIPAIQIADIVLPPEMERLRNQYARETEPANQKAIADAVQMRAREWTTHIHLGEWRLAAAARKNIAGLLAPGLPVFWNVEKN